MPGQGNETVMDFPNGDQPTTAEIPAPTSSQQVEAEPPGLASPQDPDVEVEKYGTGKPKRIVIRAKITHGNKG